MKIIFIGAGNLATRLSLEMQQAGLTICQVYSHTAIHASELAERLGCEWTTSLEAILPGADLYVFSVKDTALPSVLSAMKPNGGLWVHTAGSMPLDVFEGYSERYGVMYPLQTFSKERPVDFRKVPFFLETVSETDGAFLQEIAGRLSDDVRFLSSEKRRYLHLSAVFACNFVNRMYALAGGILEKEGIPFEVLLPLIDETAAKVHAMQPVEAQTGPAVRYDENVINKHLAMLNDPDMQAIYRLISRNIHKGDPK